MIQVGIHDNLMLSKATKNDRGTLVIGYKAVQESANALSSFDDATDDTANDGQEQDFLVYGPQATAKDNTPDTPANNSKKVKEIKDQLNHILLQYQTTDKIKWDTLRGTGITNENINEKMVEQGILDKMYANIVDQFVSMITPFVNRTDLKFRVLFIRQSKAKHFPALRKRYLSTDPFMEPMSIPKEASKLKYSKWEKDNGFDHGNPVNATISDNVNQEEAAAANSVFNT